MKIAAFDADADSDDLIGECTVDITEYCNKLEV